MTEKRGQVCSNCSPWATLKLQRVGVNSRGFLFITVETATGKHSLCWGIPILLCTPQSHLLLLVFVSTSKWMPQTTTLVHFQNVWENKQEIKWGLGYWRYCIERAQQPSDEIFPLTLFSFPPWSSPMNFPTKHNMWHDILQMMLRREKRLVAYYFRCTIY